ncbi:hypothetical protein ACLOJK_028570, partial [Asimina triloba]
MVIQVMKMIKEERKNDQMYKHGYDELVLVKREDTNIRPGYIGHQHLNDGLIPDVQVWMPAGSGNYGYKGGYTPALVGWETSIEPKCSICSGEGIHSKKIKSVKVVVEMTDVMQGQKGFGVCCLGHLMRLCPSGRLWIKKKTLILIGTWKRLPKCRNGGPSPVVHTICFLLVCEEARLIWAGLNIPGRATSRQDQ